MTDPNWTPKEPRRPLQPKPDAFGVKWEKPVDDLPQNPKPPQPKDEDGNPIQP